MGFFSRLGNLWKGFLSLWISDIEKDHPEIAYENAINSMIEKYAKLKSATAAIIRRRDDLDERYKKATAEMAQTEAELNTAVETNQDDLAVVLIQKKNGLAAEITELKTDMEAARSDADSAKSSLLSVQSEIGKLKAERDTMLAKMQSAQARMRIQESLSGLSVDDEVKALDNVRNHIKNTIADANLTKELSDSSLDSRLAALRTQTGDGVAKNTWAGHAPGVVFNNGLDASDASNYRKKYGMNVKFVLIEDPAAKLAAFRKGDVDIMWNTVDNWAREASVLAENNQQAKSVIMQDWSRGGDGIVSLASINSIEQLKGGHKISCTQFTPSHFLLPYLLSQSGLSPQDRADVEKNIIFTQDAPAAAAMFKAKQVDAAGTWEP